MQELITTMVSQYKDKIGNRSAGDSFTADLVVYVESMPCPSKQNHCNWLLSLSQSKDKGIEIKRSTVGEGVSTRESTRRTHKYGSPHLSVRRYTKSLGSTAMLTAL